MTNYFFALLFTSLCLQYTLPANATAVDSVGTVVRNGKNFTIHKVAPKETIYALARQYGVLVAQIQQANPGTGTLAVGQILYVPGRTVASVATSATPAANPVVSAPAAPPAKNTPPAAKETPDNRVHTVGNRQTLLAVARQYNVTMADLRKWNNLTSDVLKEGQLLMVGPDETTATAIAPAETNTTAATELKVEPKATASVAPPKPVVRREEIKASTARETASEKVERTETKYTESLSRISESGLAEVMDPKGDNNKYLALHKTAPVGTILQVKNTQNNQSVYVRVSGKLPEGNTNDKVIIRVSQRAHQKLAAGDDRFRVEVNYMP